MESPEPGSPLDYDDDVLYPCKGCGEVCILAWAVISSLLPGLLSYPADT